MSSTQTIHWPQQPSVFSIPLVKQIVKFVRSNMDGLFPIYKEEFIRLKKFAENNKLDIGMVGSIRNQSKIQTEIDRSRVLDTNKISEKFETFVETIKKLRTETNVTEETRDTYAKKFFKDTNFPVHAVLKIVVTLDKYSELTKDELKSLFQIKYDIIEYEKISRSNASRYEVELDKWFTAHVSTKFRTEQDLRDQLKESENSDTAVIATPDILFDEPVKIIVDSIEHIIRWVDAKNSALINIPFVMRSVNKQAAKYHSLYGLGAFVFRFGYQKGLEVNGAILLDGSGLVTYSDVKN